MVSDRGIRRWRRVAALAFVLYAFFLVTAQFEHHDVACLLKTSQHCTSCHASQLGAAPKTPVALAGHQLADAGCAVFVHLLDEGTILAASCSGRSPPATL